jgi:hypothetical protein
VDRLAHNDEKIHAVYGELDSAFSRLDYKAYLSLLSSDHETIHPDERRVTRQQLKNAAFPFDGLRECHTEHEILRIQAGLSGCSVLAQSSSTMSLGGNNFQEELLVQDLWKLESGAWKLRRRIVMRQTRKAPGHFSLVEHPLYCQFGHCRSEKRTWKESRRH